MERAGVNIQINAKKNIKMMEANITVTRIG